MAILKSVLMSSAKGSLGNITLTTQKGRVIAKEKASIVSNPRTAGQIKQRNALAQAVFLWKKIGGFVKSGITSYGRYSNPYAGFISTNIDEIKANPKNLENYDNSLLQGISATQGQFNSVVMNKPTMAGTTLTANINTSLIKAEAKNGDKIKVLAGDIHQKEMHLFTKELTDVSSLGDTMAVTFTTGTELEDSDLVVAVWYESQDGKASSTSVFQ